ncbi:MAG: hypothetical protein AAF573_06800 [Bacteroidota bacterium]
MKVLTYYFAIFLVIVTWSASSCTRDKLAAPSLEDTTIWSGPTITFEKPDGADPENILSQDRLNDDVWITRSSEGGQIFNIVTESEADKNASPAGTLWALGNTSNLTDLNFSQFRATVTRPKQVVGKELVLLLVDENVAIDIMFTSWSQSRAGGFAYERSSN